MAARPPCQVAPLALAVTAGREPALAAGALVWREVDGLEICLVHRPKYDDWSLPKGKPHAGEHLLSCAVREVAEETGHHVTLGRPLSAQRYLVSGRPKLVHYWLAEADSGAAPRPPDGEVDEVVFLPVAEALRRLTYRRDADLVARAVAGPLRTAPLVLIRHASAVPRSAWSAPDLMRPLDEQGTADAASLTDPLSTLGLRRVVSSDAVRCVDTVRPFAERHGLAVELEPQLSEEALEVPAHPDRVAKILQSLLADGPALVCSHRPVLPLLFEAAGVDSGDALAPGAFAVLSHRAEGRVAAVERHAP